MAIGDAAGAKVAGDAKLALFADFGVSAGELPGVAGIVELAGFFEARENDLGEEFRIGAAEEFGFHFVHGVRASHEDTEGVVVEVLLGVEFAGAGEHEGRIEARKVRRKQGTKPRSSPSLAARPFIVGLCSEE